MSLSLELYCDGASRGNPGRAAYGFVIKSADKIIDSRGGYLGITTNNVAEYQGLLYGLRRCLELHATHVIVRSDSLLLVRQLNREYKIRSAHLRPLFDEAMALIRLFSEVKLLHIPREQNDLADAAANEALDCR